MMGDWTAADASPEEKIDTLTVDLAYARRSIGSLREQLVEEMACTDRARYQRDEKDRELARVRDELDQAALRNSDLTAALDRALTQIPGGTW